MGDVVGVLLLAFAAALLEVGMLEQRVEAVEFGAIGVGTERLLADGYKAGDSAVLGLDDGLGGVVAVVRAANKVLKRVMIARRFQAVLDGSANQRGGFG